MSKVVKGLIMTVVTIVATSISTTGIPATVLAWEIMGITTVGTVLIYIAQSFALPSTSILGDLNGKDLLKGVLVALGNFASSLGASWATSQTVIWKDVISGAVMVVVMYILKQLATKPIGVPPTK